jgi:hypothetical protein
VQISCVAISEDISAALLSETPCHTMGILVQQNGMNN